MPGLSVGGAGATRTSAGDVRHRVGWMIKVVNSRLISLRAPAAVTVRNAQASMARVVRRYQEVQWRTWCSSRPARPLAAWKFSSVVYLRPTTFTKVARGTCRGCDSMRQRRWPSR